MKNWIERYSYILLGAILGFVLVTIVSVAFNEQLDSVWPLMFIGLSSKVSPLFFLMLILTTGPFWVTALKPVIVILSDWRDQKVSPMREEQLKAQADRVINDITEQMTNKIVTLGEQDRDRRLELTDRLHDLRLASIAQQREARRKAQIFTELAVDVEKLRAKFCNESRTKISSARKRGNNDQADRYATREKKTLEKMNGVIANLKAATKEEINSTL